MQTNELKVVDKDKIRALCDTLLTGLVERDVAIRLALIAALAGEHMLMLGPPGTAKSLVARRLQLAFADSKYFERLLTRFTVPEELFGPLSIKGLEEDRYERLTDSYLPSASIGFLDEIFKANSAILNALLTLLNEREFDNGTHRIRTPLLAVIGASNELPDGDELKALYDRFLLRLHLAPVSKEAFPSLLDLRGESAAEIPAHLKLTVSELETVRNSIDLVEVSSDVVALLCELRDWCIAEEIFVSDRRWRKIVKLLQVSALTNGRNRVSIWDCWLLQHCLWEKPEDQKKVYNWYATRVGASAMAPSKLTRIVVTWESRLKADQESRMQMRNSKGQFLYQGPDGKLMVNTKGKIQTQRTKEPLFVGPDGLADKCCNFIDDRTNGGLGFTLEELDGFRVIKPGLNISFKSWQDRTDFLTDTNNWLIDTELFAKLEPAHHKTIYIEACLKDIKELQCEVESYRLNLLTHLKSLEQEIDSHLWVTNDFVSPASENLKIIREEVEILLGRISSLQKGFEQLPREIDFSNSVGEDEDDTTFAMVVEHPRTNSGRHK